MRQSLRLPRSRLIHQSYTDCCVRRLAVPLAKNVTQTGSTRMTERNAREESTPTMRVTVQTASITSPESNSCRILLCLSSAASSNQCSSTQECQRQSQATSMNPSPSSGPGMSYVSAQGGTSTCTNDTTSTSGSDTPRVPSCPGTDAEVISNLGSNFFLTFH